MAVGKSITLIRLDKNSNGPYRMNPADFISSHPLNWMCCHTPLPFSLRACTELQSWFQTVFFYFFYWVTLFSFYLSPITSISLYLEYLYRRYNNMTVVSQPNLDRSSFVFLPISEGVKTLFLVAPHTGQIKGSLFNASGERLHRIPVVLCDVQLITERKSKGRVSTEKTWFNCRKINSGNRKWE